ncbi:MAG TPA: ABC transporter ATP-binding protein, partial [Cytophagales bacterium]|nr:ABC transporter ATP-binding protein [Cytophagales bacterium]
MKLLYCYLRHYWPLIVLALFLACINQVFSLLDPWIFRKIIDQYVVVPNTFHLRKINTTDFLQGAGLLILAAISVAMVSRIAKSFQDYYVNVITQKLGAKIYSDGLQHSLELPYAVFEDQRSGETLGILQKVRIDVEKLVASFVNVLFTTLVGVVFVTIYAINVHWLIAVVYFSTIPLLGMLSSFLSKRIKVIQKIIVSETTSLAGSTTESLRNIELVKSLGLAQQEITRLNATTEKILKLELKKVRYIRSLNFVQGTCVNFLRNSILLLMLYQVYCNNITVGEFFSLFIYSFFIFGPLQELGNIINIYRETEISLQNFQKILNTPKESKPEKPTKIEHISSLVFEGVSFKHQSSSLKALNDISFKVKQGETIAFVGPSGS